jgi:hypothetical protein
MKIPIIPFVPNAVVGIDGDGVGEAFDCVRMVTTGKEAVIGFVTRDPVAPLLTACSINVYISDPLVTLNLSIDDSEFIVVFGALESRTKETWRPDTADNEMDFENDSDDDEDAAMVMF